MSEENKDNFPYKNLGQHLRELRQKKQESLAEVSGAVEIEVNALSDIEYGKHRPSEDILLLLISHFETKEDEASKLWELAGFDQEADITHMMNDDNGQAQPSVMVMPTEARIVYTDMVHVMVNNYGVVMNFMQGTGPNNQPLAIARVGMSKEHAKSVLEVLEKTLKQSEQQVTPKALPAPQSKKRTNK